MSEAGEPLPPRIPPPKDLAALQLEWTEFRNRHDGMIHAMSGGLWLHRHLWLGKRLAHLVSCDKEWLLAWGRRVGIPEGRLQYHPLKDPRDGVRRDAWHWDLGGPYLPPPR